MTEIEAQLLERIRRLEAEVARLQARDDQRTQQIARLAIERYLDECDAAEGVALAAGLASGGVVVLEQRR